MVSSPNMVHSMDARCLNEMRHDRFLDINGRGCKVSFLPMFQTIVYTCLPNSVTDQAPAGTINLERPFASQTPADFLLINEIEHHIETGEPTT